MDRLIDAFLISHDIGGHAGPPGADGPSARPGPTAGNCRPAVSSAVGGDHARAAFPGCDQPASVCDIHHLTPRARGGPTALPNLVPLCGFHHQIAVHRQGWILRLNPDGTTTATSPDRTRTLHSHGPPPQRAA